MILETISAFATPPLLDPALEDARPAAGAQGAIRPTPWEQPIGPLGSRSAIRSLPDREPSHIGITYGAMLWVVGINDCSVEGRHLRRSPAVAEGESVADQHHTCQIILADAWSTYLGAT